jgi:glycosyltransferase involved in cell wall biosynthesis
MRPASDFENPRNIQLNIYKIKIYFIKKMSTKMIMPAAAAAPAPTARISLITPTQTGRIKSIFLLKEMVLEQTYIHKVAEWVFSTVATDMRPHMDRLQKEIAEEWEAALTKLNIAKEHQPPPLRVVLVECEKDSKIGRLRNKANNAAKEDIIICLDDDDYYPPERLEHAYDSLIKSDKLIAGCSPTYLYDFVFDQQYQFVTLGDNHTINCAMAFKKEYLKNHSHDETATNAEEFSFTNLWAEPMIALDPLKTINVSSHAQNTYNKRHLLIAFHHGRYKQFQTLPACMIPKRWYDRMKEIFLGPPTEVLTNAEKTHTIPVYKSPYDIVYFCGEAPKWNPEDESLGGSEQAVRHLSTEWAAQGKKVAVYANIDTGEGLADGVYSKKHQLMNIAGVDYINWMNFPYNQTFATLILWRSAGLAYTFFAKIKATKIILDLHDNARVVPIMDVYRAFISNNRTPDRIIFKSNYHRLEFEDMCKKSQLPLMANEIIPNGLRVKDIRLHDGQKREEYRFCYTSCYTRGLELLLAHTWPEIIKAFPRAELHVYYGMDLVQDANYKLKMHALIGSTPNVMNHGRKPLELIAQEKYKSSFHLYFTESPAEIDCIAIRESVLCGCIPILSNRGVFIERDGLRFGPPKTEPETPLGKDDYIAVGKAIIDLLRNREMVFKLREQLKESKMLYDWSAIAGAWANLI